MKGFGRRFRHQGWRMETALEGPGCGRHGRRLSSLRSGETCVVASEMLPPDLIQKLFPMGLEKEGEIEILSGGRHNPFLIRAGETRIVLDWNTVNRIPVKG